jgi:hypothetical protein
MKEKPVTLSLSKGGRFYLMLPLVKGAWGILPFAFVVVRFVRLRIAADNFKILYCALRSSFAVNR